MINDDASPSAGERHLQHLLGTGERAEAFYDRQVHPGLTPAMREFVGRQSMAFLSTADARGNCDASFRAGPPGFIAVLDDDSLAYPEYRGNGVLASAGNITENPHIGLLLMDFSRHHIGLHINGRARLFTDHEMRARHPGIPADTAPGRRPELWVHVAVQEAYIHCSKNIPHLEPAPRPQRSQSDRPKDPDYFTVHGAAGGGAPQTSEPLPHPNRHPYVSVRAPGS